MRAIVTPDGAIRDLNKNFRKNTSELNKGFDGTVGEYNKHSIHIFDSSFGVSNGHGFTFRYSHSLDKIIGYRVVDFLVTNIAMPFTSPNYIALHSNLSRSSFSGHRNGKAENIISCITNPGTGARIKWNYILGECIPIELDSLYEVYLELRDSTGTPLTSLGFVVTIEFTHQF